MLARVHLLSRTKVRRTPWMSGGAGLPPFTWETISANWIRLMGYRYRQVPFLMMAGRRPGAT